MAAIVIRALAPGEEHVFLDLADRGLVGAASAGVDYRARLASGEYRPEWSWVAVRDGRTVARAAWWGGPLDSKPRKLDWFDFDDPTAGEELLRAAPWRTDFCLILPPDWKQRPAVYAAAACRIEVARQVGMSPLVERLHYTWTTADGVPERTGRLEYWPVPDDETVLDVLRQTGQGSKDARHQRIVRERGLAAAAEDELSFLRWMPSPREWWRIARTPEGELVGLVAPGRNYAGPLIGSLGIVPSQRGRGYGYDMHVEATNLLVELGAEQISADTDATNTPMVSILAKAGFPVTQRRLHLELSRQ